MEMVPEIINHTRGNMNFYIIDVLGEDLISLDPGSDGSFYQAEFTNNGSFGGTAVDIDNDGNDEGFFLHVVCFKWNVHNRLLAIILCR